tara:strand:- start:65295 stop:65609 length:315 start_codon:yes stop_codon:yes gene_type:complete
MSFKNFKVPTIGKIPSPIYGEIIQILLKIQKDYPKLYSELNKDPQFEDTIVINRYHERYAIKYLNFLRKLISEYEQLNSITQISLSRKNSAISEFTTPSYATKK